VNRCLAEGRERFRAFLTRSESGGRCAELQPVLSAFCDGEAGADETSALREHLRVCASCRATMRAYCAAPGAVAVLAPVPIAARPLLERAQEALAGLQARLPGRGGALGEASMSQVAAGGGPRGMGTAALAKVLAICAGTAGGAAVCVTAGVVPAPLGLAPDHTVRPHVERVAESFRREAGAERVVTPVAEPVAEPVTQEPRPEPVEEQPPPVTESSVEVAETAPTESATSPPEPEPSSGAAAQQATSPGSAAGEFGP
jgi:Putative zinc-finger